LTEAVAPLAGAYDLTDARAAISTALAAGRAEVRLNHARQRARIQARDFDIEMNTRLQEATSDADVVALLDGAHEYAVTLEDQLAAALNEILDEARLEPGLASRMPEAEAYSEHII